MDALNNMLRQVVVSSADFHKVYGRILDCPEYAGDEGIRGFFDLMLHNTDTAYDIELFQRGQICTVGSSERIYLAPKNIRDNDGEASQWIAKNLSLEKRISEL